MSRYLFPKLTLAFFFVAATIPVFSQVAPAAEEGGLPLVVGVGISDYDLDWGYGSRMIGISAWADWQLEHLPGQLRNLSIEAEGHAIDYDRPARVPSTMRQDTGLGGLSYTWRHYRNLRPYAKFLGGIGSIDFGEIPPPNPFYTHDTFSVFAPGGGVEYRFWRQFWVRGEYEYQFWQHTFGPRDLTPSGFTIGASYHFRGTYPSSR
ncbi:MAG: outer membrane beta-barrel protein [Terracidiphilus sp.]|jgi:opacity protein-like surface antigen